VLECTTKFGAENDALKYPIAHIWFAPKTNRYVQNWRVCLMRFLGLVALIGLFLSILDASTASADQCPARDSPIVTDRPDVTNSSLVVPQGSFQSENGINFSQRGGNNEFDGTESRLRWGIVPCLEVLVDLPTYVAAIRGSLNSGLTNVIRSRKDRSFHDVWGWTADRQQGDRGPGTATLPAISVVVGVRWWLGH
jgi:hypothetical protein